MSTIENVNVLLVEDNPGDVRLTQEALKDSKLTITLHVVEDGVAALEILRNEPPYEDAPRPDVVLLDLNLPRKDGREVLSDVKSDPNLRDIPVVVLTTSGAPEDIGHSYAKHANCYVQKPLDFDQFVTIVRQIEGFWFTIVRLPRT